MAIVFNNIPDTIRTPGVYVEIDNSRALKGLVQNPHKALIIGQLAEGLTTPTPTALHDTLYAISRDNLADGFFGRGSILARMCNTFKNNNPNTELFAMAIGSGIAGTAAKTTINVSGAVYSNAVSANGTWYLMINGETVECPITSGMSAESIAARMILAINSNSNLPVTAVAGASPGIVSITAICSGTLGNYIDIRENFYDHESIPLHFVSGSTGPLTVGSGGLASRIFFSRMANGATDPDLGDVWAVIDNEQFHYIIQPWITAANLTEIEDELADRFLPLEDLQGHGFTCVRVSAIGSIATLGNARNSPHNTIIAMDDSPTCPEEWTAAWGAVAAWNLNNDPARPLHTLQLKGILPPPISKRYTRAERDTILYDGIATWIVSGGKVLIERSITTYQTNAFGFPDPSYLDIQTLATLGEIRYQYKVRMLNRFLQPRFKLADDTFPAQPGSKVARPKDVFSETVALFTLLRDKGLIENLDEFINNLVVERDITDRNRVNVLLPADIINQFRVLAGNIQFIL